MTSRLSKVGQFLARDSLKSEKSQSGGISGESLVAAASDGLQSYNVDLDHRTYLDTIRENRTLFTAKYFEIENVCPEMKIKSMDGIQIDMFVNANILRMVCQDLEKRLRIVNCMRFLNTEKGKKLFKQYLCHEDNDSIYKKLFFPQKYDDTLLSVIGKKFNVPRHKTIVDLTHSKHFEAFSKIIPRKHQSRRCLSMMEHLNSLYTTLEPRLKLTAKETTQKYETLREAMKVSSHKKIMIDSINANMHQAEIYNMTRIKGTEREIEGYYTKMRALQERNREIIHFMQHMSERAMALKDGASQIMIDQFQATAMEATERFEELMFENMKVEKKMRVSRFKIETKLATCLNKYDTVMLEKQAEIDEVSELKDQEFEELMELQCLYNEQRKRYQKFKKIYDKEQEEMQILIEAFMVLRATKVIQKWWRIQYKRIKLERKKKRAHRSKSPKKSPPKTKGSSPPSKKGAKTKGKK